VYMVPESDAAGQKFSRQKDTADTQKKAGAIGLGPKVTVLDPATRKTELVDLPRYTDTAASKPLWKPLWDELRARMKKRGL
jgi:hypothetical protein